LAKEYGVSIFVKTKDGAKMVVNIIKERILLALMLRVNNSAISMACTIAN